MAANVYTCLTGICKSPLTEKINNDAPQIIKSQKLFITIFSASLFEKMVSTIYSCPTGICLSPLYKKINKDSLHSLRVNEEKENKKTNKDVRNSIKTALHHSPTFEEDPSTPERIFVTRERGNSKTWDTVMHIQHEEEKIIKEIVTEEDQNATQVCPCNTKAECNHSGKDDVKRLNLSKKFDCNDYSRIVMVLKDDLIIKYSIAWSPVILCVEKMVSCFVYGIIAGNEEYHGDTMYNIDASCKKGEGNPQKKLRTITFGFTKKTIFMLVYILILSLSMVFVCMRCGTNQLELDLSSVLSTAENNTKKWRVNDNSHTFVVGSENQLQPRANELYSNSVFTTTGNNTKKLSVIDQTRYDNSHTSGVDSEHQLHHRINLWVHHYFQTMKLMLREDQDISLI